MKQECEKGISLAILAAVLYAELSNLKKLLLKKCHQR